MKTGLVIVLLVGAFAISCSKHYAAVPFNNLCGAWKDIGAKGFEGQKFTLVPDSVKNFLQFNTTRLLFNTKNGQNCTGYTFTQDSSGIFAGLLTLKDTSISPRMYDVSLTNDTLSLYPHGVAGRYATCYARSLKVFNWCDSSKGH
jgi:hypothetical protein